MSLCGISESKSKEVFGTWETECAWLSRCALCPSRSFFASWVSCADVMASMRPYSSSKRFLVLFMGLILLASHVQLTKGDNDPLETELSTVAQEVPLPNAIPATAIEERYRLPFLKMRELMNAVYEHKPLASLQYTFESKVYGSLPAFESLFALLLISIAFTNLWT